MRATFAGSSTVAPGSTVGVRTALVPVVRPTAAVVRVARYHAAAVRAVVTPPVAFGPVIVQRHSSAGWRTVAVVRTGRTGLAALRVPTGSRGRSYYRFIVPGTALHLPAASSVVTVWVV